MEKQEKDHELELFQEIMSQDEKADDVQPETIAEKATETAEQPDEGIPETLEPVKQADEDALEAVEPVKQADEDALEAVEPAKQLDEDALEAVEPVKQADEDALEAVEPAKQLNADVLEAVEPAKESDENKPDKKANKKGISIRYRLIASYCVAIILIIVLGVVSYRRASDAITESFENNTVAVLERSSDYYKLVFQTIKQTALELTTNPDVRAYYAPVKKQSQSDSFGAYNSMSMVVKDTLVKDDLLSNIYIMSDELRPMYTQGSFDLENSAAFANSTEAALIDEHKFVWLGRHPYIDEQNALRTTSVSQQTSPYGLVFARQLLGGAYNKVGYLILDVSLPTMHMPLDGLDFGHDSAVLFITSDGSELFSLQDKENEAMITESSENRPVDNLVFGTEYYDRAMTAYQEDPINCKGSEYVDYLGEAYLFSYYIFDDFMLSSMVPRSVILKDLESIQYITAAVVIASIILSAIIALLIAGSMTSVIRKLMNGLEHFASGNLQVNIKIKRRDEFGVLAKSANHAMENIRDLVSEADSISRDVHASADTVTENARTLLTATREITNSVTEIEEGLLQQAEDTQNCMTQMEVLSDKITQVSANSERISAVSVETQATVNEGIEVIHDLNDKASETEIAAREIMQSIAELQVASNSIVNIVNAINEISEQTNLLSLNASIEAARAGDAGRGFAVVADEIRKLSEQSAHSANQIKAYVDEITKKTQVTVTYAKKSEEVVGYQRTQINRTVEMFTMMTKQFTELTDSLSSISTGIDDIQKTKQGTLAAVESISAISQETAAAAEEVTANVNLQLQSLEDFNSQADELIRVSSNLSEAIGRFTI